MENAPSESCPTCGSWWRLPLLLALVLAAIVWSRIRNQSESPQSGKHDPDVAAGATSGATVSLAIDFGDGRRKNFGTIAWHDGMTVADAIHNAPGLNIIQQGS